MKKKREHNYSLRERGIEEGKGVKASGRRD
jgi:hypothetical protein